MLSAAGKDAEAIAECQKLLGEFKLPAEQNAVRVTLSSIYSTAGDTTKAEKELRIALAMRVAASLAGASL